MIRSVIPCHPSSSDHGYLQMSTSSRLAASDVLGLMTLLSIHCARLFLPPSTYERCRIPFPGAHWARKTGSNLEEHKAERRGERLESGERRSS